MLQRIELIEKFMIQVCTNNINLNVIKKESFIMNGLEKYLYSKVKIYIYTTAQTYNNEKADVILEGITLEKVEGNFIDIKDEQDIVHRINLDKCFSIVVEPEGSNRY